VKQYQGIHYLILKSTVIARLFIIVCATILGLTGVMSRTQDAGRKCDSMPTAREMNICALGNSKVVLWIPPEYPKQALISGIEGWVDVQFTIEPRGSVIDVKVRDSSPPGVFEEVALKAARRWRFSSRSAEGSYQLKQRFVFEFVHQRNK